MLMAESIGFKKEPMRAYYRGSTLVIDEAVLTEISLLRDRRPACMARTCASCDGGLALTNREVHRNEPSRTTGRPPLTTIAANQTDDDESRIARTSSGFRSSAFRSRTGESSSYNGRADAKPEERQRSGFRNGYNRLRLWCRLRRKLRWAALPSALRGQYRSRHEH